MRQMIKTIVDFFSKRYIEKKLVQYAKENSTSFPQLACYTFDYIAIQINIYGRYENELLECLSGLLSKAAVDKRRICLDVGANIGNHSLYFSHYFDRVISFEPNKKIFQILKINSSKVDNVFPVNIGASDKNSVVKMDYSEWNMGGGKVKLDEVMDETNAIKNEYAQVSTLDEMVDKEDRDKIDLIKIDVEGHELRALKGMTSILRYSTPIVIIEQHGDDVIIDNEGVGSSSCINFLKEYGYSNIYEIGFTNDLAENSAYFVAKIIKLINLINLNSHRSYEIKKVDILEKKFYPMLLLSKHNIFQ
jgi:FkbM family methyltransferase